MTSKPRRSLRVVHVITGLGDGGAEGALYRLCIHDQKNIHHVISLMGMGKYGPMLQDKGVEVSCLNVKSGSLRILPALWTMWKIIRHYRPDVIQTWMYHADLLGGIIGRMTGCSNVCWGLRNGTLNAEDSSRTTVLISRFCKVLSWIIPRKIVSCAQRASEEHIQLGYNANKICLIPNGYNLNDFTPDIDAGENLRNLLGLNRSDKVIGFVARFDPMKDHQNLFVALCKLRERGITPKCILVGTGMTIDNQKITHLLNKFSLMDQVILLGRRNDIPAVMNALDFHVLSSSSEAFPNVLAEAMACGTPCISTDVGDAASILGSVGKVVPCRDPSALATAIESMFVEVDSDGWRERCYAARSHVERNFSMEQMLDSYQKVWTGINLPSVLN